MLKATKKGITILYIVNKKSSELKCIVIMSKHVKNFRHV
jgi:hypothetical protein